MAYRYDKNLNGQYDLVIDGWENGIASSPFKGIGNIRNLNVKYYDGVAYVNYKRQACTITGGTLGNPRYATQSPAGLIYICDDAQQIFKQSAVNSSTFAKLTGNSAQDIRGIQFWNNYLLVFGADNGGRIEICGDGTGDSGIDPANWNQTNTSTTTFTVTIASPAVFTTASPHGLSAGDNIRLSTSGSLPTGLSINTNYYVISAGLTATEFEVSTTIGGSAVNTSGTQSGTHSFSVARGVWPILNQPTVTATAIPGVGATSATISSAVDSQGTTRGVWNGPTGFYNMAFSGTNQVVLAFFQQGSNAITWNPELVQTATATSLFPFYNSNTYLADNIEHMSLIAANDGNVYFLNGPNIGAFKLTPGRIFNKADMTTFEFSANILSLPPTETSKWLMELKDKLIILGKYRMYNWDFVSSYWVNPVPIDEQLVKGINILNNLYIFAGNKGNIYLSNGYSFSRYVKLPDYIAGVVDPSWNIGGIGQHRQKLYFQALAKNGQTDAAIFAGIFSLDLDTNALIMENQNSGGLAPTGITAGGLIIDDSDLTINYDKYYSAFSATTPSIDFNDTTLYSSSEAVIETDIIPVGTALQPKTFQSAEFKLDQPLQSGDSITLEARESLSASWTTIGTTTTAVLSFATTPLTFQNWQWIQFRVKMSCNATASSSSFNRLREIRIR